MDSKSLIDAFDRDGAIGELAEEVSGDDRAGFLRKVGVGGATILGGGAFLGALPQIASAATIPAGDIAILNFALTLEYLESAFYTEANANGKLAGTTARFSTVVANHEFSHVKFLEGILGKKAVATPKFNFKGTTSDSAMFQATADALENTGVHAYLGQVPNIKTKAVLVGAGRILPVEARHAAWIRDIRFAGGTDNNTTPAPSGFEDGFTKAAVLAIVTGTGFIVG